MHWCVKKQENKSHLVSVGGCVAARAFLSESSMFQCQMPNPTCFYKDNPSFSRTWASADLVLTRCVPVSSEHLRKSTSSISCVMILPFFRRCSRPHEPCADPGSAWHQVPFRTFTEQTLQKVARLARTLLGLIWIAFRNDGNHAVT